MAKKINPKDQTIELSRAKWEFLRRNPEALAAYEEMWGSSFRAFCKKYGISDEEAEATIKESMAVPAVINGNLILSQSWSKVLRKLKTHPLLYSYEEKTSKYREQILKDAKDILNILIFPDPSRSLVVVVNLDRSKEAIMAEVKEIVTHELNLHHEALSKVWVFDENKKFIGIEQNDKKNESRLKWLSIVDELLAVWDLYESYDKRRCFSLIAKKLRISESTVKARWRRAYKLIYEKDYTREQDNSEMCAGCNDQIKCYKVKKGVMEFLPCAAYLKLAGSGYTREKLFENIEEIMSKKTYEDFLEIED